MCIEFSSVLQKYRYSQLLIGSHTQRECRRNYEPTGRTCGSARTWQINSALTCKIATLAKKKGPARFRAGPVNFAYRADLELIAETKLHHARVGVGVGGDGACRAGGGIAGEIAYRKIELGMIEEVEELGAELEAPGFAPREALQHAQIPVCGPGPGKGVAPGVANIAGAGRRGGAARNEKRTGIEGMSGIAHVENKRLRSRGKGGPVSKLVEAAEIGASEIVPNGERKTAAAGDDT